MLESVRRYRLKMPRIGSRKLYEMVKKELGSHPLFPGRDRFLDCLYENHLMLKIKRRKRYKTTDSNHPYKRYPNLIKERVFTAANQAWASDITYIETKQGVCYLSVITDLYSHKIVGWCLGNSLQAIHCHKALNQALSNVKDKTQLIGLIHHSDRGCQYCSYDYVNRLKAYGIEISMTESGDPLENAVAERINGIIKNELLHGLSFSDQQECFDCLTAAIDAYNYDRPHMSLGYQTSAEAHEQTGEQKRHWKTWSERLKNKDSQKDFD